MADREEIDQFDRKILALLQADARLTNNDLSERVNLSPSQCSRRRQRLEEDGTIKGYRAVLDFELRGLPITLEATGQCFDAVAAERRGATSEAA